MLYVVIWSTRGVVLPGGRGRQRVGGGGVLIGDGDEPAGKAAAPAVAHIKIPDDREQQRADKVDEEILHRVQQADVQVPAQAQGRLRAVGLYDDQVGDVVQHDGLVAAGGVQQDGADAVDDGVFLHVKKEELVHQALKKFPADADGHRKAERDDGQVQRR